VCRGVCVGGWGGGGGGGHRRPCSRDPIFSVRSLGNAVLFSAP